MRPSILSLTLALCVGQLPALAQSSWNEPRYHFGFGFHFSQPLGDLKTDLEDRAGFGFSLNMPMDYGRGHVLRPRWDITVHSFPRYRTLDNHRDSNLTAMTLGMDYMLYLSGRSSIGPYLLGGVGVDFWSLDLRDDDYYYDHYYDHDRRSENSTSFCSTLGMGFQFSRRMALEFKVKHSEYKFTTLTTTTTNNANATRTANTYQMGMQFRW